MRQALCQVCDPPALLCLLLIAVHRRHFSDTITFLKATQGFDRHLLIFEVTGKCLSDLFLYDIPLLFFTLIMVILFWRIPLLIRIYRQVSSKAIFWC